MLELCNNIQQGLFYFDVYFFASSNQSGVLRINKNKNKPRFSYIFNNLYNIKSNHFTMSCCKIFFLFVRSSIIGVHLGYRGRGVRKGTNIKNTAG
jgi:hypothetical protein